MQREGEGEGDGQRRDDDGGGLTGTWQAAGHDVVHLALAEVRGRFCSV